MAPDSSSMSTSGTDRTEADEWTKVMETIVPPQYPPEIRDQIDSKFVTRKGESGDHHTGIFGKAKEPLGNSNSYPNRTRCDAMVHDGMVDSRNGEVIPMDDVFWTAEYMNAYDLNSQLSAVRAEIWLWRPPGEWGTFTRTWPVLWLGCRRSGHSMTASTPRRSPQDPAWFAALSPDRW